MFQVEASKVEGVMGTTTFSRLKAISARAKAVLSEQTRTQEEGEVTPQWENFVRFWVLVGRSFIRNRGPARASALAYTTLLALVPLLAVAISISTSLLKGKDSEEKISRIINTAIDNIAPQLDLVSKTEVGGDTAGRKKVAESISTYVQNVNSGTLGATAIFALVLVAISLLSTIEATLNDMWGAASGRTWGTRVVYYWAVITLGPIFLLLIMGLNYGPYFEKTRRYLEMLPWIATVIYQLMPMFVLILLLTGFYKLMPAAKVHFTAALAGGAVAGGLIHLNNVFSGMYFGQVVRNSKIYGSLGILPVFLLGLYISWVVLLFGAQVAYAFQNRRVYMQDKAASNVNERGKEFLALRIMTYIATRFALGMNPPSALEIGKTLEISSRFVCLITAPLCKCGLLVETTGKDAGYVPGKPLKQITSYDILYAMRAGMGDEARTPEDGTSQVVRAEFSAITEAERLRGEATTLEDLVRNCEIELAKK